MARKRNLTPSYLKHKQTGQARATWTDALGIRQQRLLPGPFDSPESRTAFAKLQLEICTSPTRAVVVNNISVVELFVLFLDHAEQHYRRADGTTTHELSEYKLICRHVRELYGTNPATEFGPLALRAVRQKFIDLGWCRSLVNQRIGRVRRIFKWGASQELIPVAIPQALGTVQGLQKGRSQVRESKPVEPVADDVVDATMPFLNRHVRGLVEFQRLTGCRPGEACVLRRADIDMSGDVWLFRPPHHKNSWRGKSRTIAIGPKAQELIRMFFTPDLGDYLFSPARAVEEFHAERGARRKTPRFASHMTRNVSKRKAAPERAPADKYDADSYGKSVDRGCDRAFPPPAPLARREGETKAGWWKRLNEEQKRQVQAWQKSHRWHPNRLRHTHATEVRKRFGLEAAQVALGHARADITQLYAERDGQLAEQVASKIG